MNAVCPAFTRTPTVDALTAGNPEFQQRLPDPLHVGRLGTVAEIAEAIAYLCSGGAGFTNGHARVLDGGASIG